MLLEKHPESRQEPAPQKNFLAGYCAFKRLVKPQHIMFYGAQIHSAHVHELVSRVRFLLGSFGQKPTDKSCLLVTCRLQYKTLSGLARRNVLMAAAIAINPERIVGNWILGYALDIHTISSIHVGINEYGHDVFDTERSELGKLLYRLKYKGDLPAADAIIEAAVIFLKSLRNKFRSDRSRSVFRRSSRPAGNYFGQGY